MSKSTAEIYKIPVKILNDIANDIVREMKMILEEEKISPSNLVFNGPFDKIATGTLYNSLTSEVKVELYRYIKGINEYNVIFNTADYAEDVDQGSKPGKMVDMNSLKKWMGVRGIPAKAANPIARKIFIFGIDPRPFLYKIDGFETRLNNKIKLIEDEMSEKLLEQLTKDIENIFISR